ncbi:MAG: DUF2273 domain-containing protein [Bacillota bacterium]
MDDQDNSGLPRGWLLVAEVMTRHRGKLTGSLLGLVLAVMIMRVGPWWTGFIALSVYVGYRLGKQVDDEKETLFEIIEKYLPPGGSR